MADPIVLFAREAGRRAGQDARTYHDCSGASGGAACRSARGPWGSHLHWRIHGTEDAAFAERLHMESHYAVGDEGRSELDVYPGRLFANQLHGAVPAAAGAVWQGD